MSDDEHPIDTITRLVEERRGRSDATILAELRALPVLPDEDHQAWDDGSTWDHHAGIFLALAAVVRERRLHEGVPLLLERACYGDPGETMRGLRHTLEAVYNPGWSMYRIPSRPGMYGLLWIGSCKNRPKRNISLIAVGAMAARMWPSLRRARALSRISWLRLSLRW